MLFFGAIGIYAVGRIRAGTAGWGEWVVAVIGGIIVGGVAFALLAGVVFNSPKLKGFVSNIIRKAPEEIVFGLIVQGVVFALGYAWTKMK